MLQHDQDSTYPRFAEAYVASVTPLLGLEQLVRCTEGPDYKQNHDLITMLCVENMYEVNVCNAVI